jgi:adenosine deaminase
MKLKTQSTNKWITRVYSLHLSSTAYPTYPACLTFRVMSICLKNLPKIELHAHLNGCIRNTTLLELAAQRNVSIHDYSVAGRRSLEECFDLFAKLANVVTDLPALERITMEALQDFANHSVVYLELRSTPKVLLFKQQQQEHGCSKNELAGKDAYVQTILTVMKDFMKQEQQRFQNDPDGRPPLVCRLLISVDRSQSLQEARENVLLAKHHFSQKDNLVVGVDLGGNPTLGDFRMFLPIFVDARQAGLKVTLHCAEVDCDEGPRYEELKAMFDFLPDRFGHALLVPESLRQWLGMIPVECCPTSNVMTLELNKLSDGCLIRGLRQHPSLQHWIDTNHPLAIGTDDPGVFDTNATKELALIQQAYNLSTPAIAAMLLRSIDLAFCDVSVKKEIWRCMKHRLDYLEVDYL